MLSVQVGSGLLSGIQLFIGVMVDFKGCWIEDVAPNATRCCVDVSACELAAKLSKIVLELIVEHRQLFVEVLLLSELSRKELDLFSELIVFKLVLLCFLSSFFICLVSDSPELAVF